MEGQSQWPTFSPPTGVWEKSLSVFQEKQILCKCLHKPLFFHGLTFIPLLLALVGTNPERVKLCRRTPDKEQDVLHITQQAVQSIIQRLSDLMFSPIGCYCFQFTCTVSKLNCKVHSLPSKLFCIWQNRDLQHTCILVWEVSFPCVTPRWDFSSVHLWFKSSLHARFSTLGVRDDSIGCIQLYLTACAFYCCDHRWSKQYNRSWGRMFFSPKIQWNNSESDHSVVFFLLFFVFVPPLYKSLLYDKTTRTIFIELIG